MTTLTALALAPAAQDWIAATTRARLLNVFDRACNLINQEGDILALVTTERGLTPFGMVVASAERAPFQNVAPTDPISLAPRCLTLGAIQISLDSASVWNPVPDWPALRALFASRPALSDELRAAVLRSALAGSLLALHAPRLADQSEMGRALLAQARSPAARLAHGLRIASEAVCVEGARGLAGLGGGLTPAGDDFIVGALLAAWAGLFGPGAERLSRAVAEAAAPLTTALSAAYVRAAARGECTAHWHELFEALCAWGEERLRVGIGELLSVGHTSGADALAGFLSARA
jgi:hypothetical protein